MKYRCPNCKADTDSSVHKNFPFCSERCRNQDLGNWASEKYVVSEPVFDEDELARAQRKPSILPLDEEEEKRGDDGR